MKLAVEMFKVSRDLSMEIVNELLVVYYTATWATFTATWAG